MCDSVQKHVSNDEEGAHSEDLHRGHLNLVRKWQQRGSIKRTAYICVLCLCARRRRRRRRCFIFLFLSLSLILQS